MMLWIVYTCLFFTCWNSVSEFKRTVYESVRTQNRWIKSHFVAWSWPNTHIDIYFYVLFQNNWWLMRLGPGDYSKIWFLGETQLKFKPVKSDLTLAYTYISFTRSLWSVDISCFWSQDLWPSYVGAFVYIRIPRIKKMILNPGLIQAPFK